MSEKPAESKWHRPEMWVVWGLSVALLMILAWLWARERGWLGSGAKEAFSPESRLAAPIEVNTASAADLQHVRGIGEKRAQEILLKRSELIHAQKADKSRKLKTIGWSDVDDFIKSVKTIPGITPEMENELRRTVVVRPLSR